MAQIYHVYATPTKQLLFEANLANICIVRENETLFIPWFTQVGSDLLNPNG